MKIDMRAEIAHISQPSFAGISNVVWKTLNNHRIAFRFSIYGPIMGVLYEDFNDK